MTRKGHRCRSDRRPQQHPSRPSSPSPCEMLVRQRLVIRISAGGQVYAAAVPDFCPHTTLLTSLSFSVQRSATCRSYWPE